MTYKAVVSVSGLPVQPAEVMEILNHRAAIQRYEITVSGDGLDLSVELETRPAFGQFESGRAQDGLDFLRSFLTHFPGAG